MQGIERSEEDTATNGERRQEGQTHKATSRRYKVDWNAERATQQCQMGNRRSNCSTNREVQHSNGIGDKNEWKIEYGKELASTLEDKECQIRTHHCCS